MTIYNWLTLLGVPGMFAALIGFIRIQIKQNRAMKNGMQAIFGTGCCRLFSPASGRDLPIRMKGRTLRTCIPSTIP